MKLTQVIFGATRRIMSGKHGNKNFYKGRGVRNAGVPTKWGGYRFIQKKIPQYVVPDLTGCKLKPYVAYQAVYEKVPPMTADLLDSEIRENIDLIHHKEIP